jgi:hypothetical protein
MSDRSPLSEEQFHEEIDRRLNALRPPRYQEDDRAWMAPVIAWAEQNMPPSLRERAMEEGDGR